MSASSMIRSQTHLTTFEKLALAVTALACFGIWFFLGNQVGVPVQPGFSTSLIASGSWLGLLAVIAILPVLTIIASLLVGRIRFEAGLFCAAIGLVIWPARGGDIRTTLHEASSSAVYNSLAIECAILGTGVLATYLVIQKLRDYLHTAPAITAPNDDPDTASDRVTVILTQAIGTLIMLAIFCQAPTKGQTLASICLGAMLSTMIIHQIYAVSGSFWYLAGTMLAGVIAYLYTGFFGNNGFTIAEVRGIFAGAARPLPMHYATLGVAGTIFGYWCSLVWRAARTEKSAHPKST